LPPLTTRFLVKVAPLTAPAVKLAAVPEMFVPTKAEGVPASPPDINAVMFPLPKSEVELIVLMLVPETKVSCLEDASPLYKELAELSPVLEPETEVVPVTAKVGVVEPEMTTELTEDGTMAPSVKVMAGVVVSVATLPEIPLAVATETVVTVPVPFSAIFPFNLLIAPTIESEDDIVPVVLEYPVNNFPTTAASVKEAVGKALVASVP
jgi:hypothetical protein